MTSGSDEVGVDEEIRVDQALRPRTFVEYVGQARVRENLEVAIAAAKKRGDSLDHVLLHGPPGLGKTSLANLVAREMGVRMLATSGPVLERKGDLVALLTNLEEGQVLFIDEIHRLAKPVEESIYPALDVFEIDLVIGEGPGAKAVRLPIRQFTLVGATTRAGLLTKPLRSRFGATFRLDFYSEDELLRILERSAALLDVRLADVGARELARRSRGTPRIANRLLRRARDFAQARADGVIDADVCRTTLELLDIDEAGLEATDRALLALLVERFDGGPVGLGTLAAALGEEAQTLEDVYEPFLIREGFLHRTPQGRVATDRAWAHFGKQKPAGGQGRLFRTS